MPHYDELTLGVDKAVVVIDIGSAYTKCGFASETGPRCILPSEVRLQKSGKTAKLRDELNSQELYSLLVEFCHLIFFRHLLASPKDRRIVVVENLFATTKFRNTLAKVLFKQCDVLSVGFATSHVVAVLTLGIPSALVIDLGYTHTTALPVFEGIPLLSSCQSVPKAGKAIHLNAERILKETSSIRLPVDNEIPLALYSEPLSESLYEDLKVRTCFVTKFERSKQLLESSVMPPNPCPGFEYPLSGDKILHVDGSLREKACEVLFERDGEELSIPMLILNSLIKSPIDTRKKLAENIVVMGGTAMLPGLKHRLIAELDELVNSTKYKNELGLRSFKIHSPPAKENYVAWLGGAIYGALEVLGARSVSREQFNKGSPLPDWCLTFHQEYCDENLSKKTVKSAVK